MPQQQQSIVVSGFDKESILAICYSAFKQLNWDVLFAGEEKLVGATPKSWKANSQQIIATGADGLLTLSSEMTQNESFDLGGKNKKNIATFLTSFENCRSTVTETTIQQNLATINELRTKTQQVAEQEVKDAAEIDAAMNLSNSNLYVTYAIMGINVLVFILMAMNGAGIMEANGLVHIKWGSNYTPLTLSGDWWRLVTNVFIHFGIIHLAMNMYCLYTVGVYLEPMLGKAKYITAYLCTGVLASVVSLWWHKDGVNSAGASGAIFGMYGLFLALLTTNLIPKQVRQPLLQSIGIFVVYNLVYGMKGGVDNAAHVGGLISGFIIGYLYVLGIKKEKQNEKAAWVLPLVLLLSIGGAYGYLQQHKISQEQRIVELNRLQDQASIDFDKYADNMNKFSDIETNALKVYNSADSNISKTEYADLLKLAIPNWDTAIALLKTTKSFSISETAHRRVDKLLEYAELRRKEFTLLVNLNAASAEEEDETTKKNLAETEGKLSEILKQLKVL